jgi:hypothetical protein
MALNIEIASHGYRAAMPAATSSTAGLIMISTDGLANPVYVVSLDQPWNDPDRLDLSPVLPWL